MLETERLILRPFKDGDEKDLYEYLSTIRINCFKSMQISSLHQAYDEVIKRKKDHDYYFAIVLKDTGKVIGEIFAHPESTNHDNEVLDTYSPCWMLNRDYQGKGYAYEAAKTFFDYLFNQKNARRLYAYTEDYNLSSQKLCEKLGMRREGLFIEFVSFVNDEQGNPIYENTYQYALLNKEWNK